MTSRRSMGGYYQRRSRALQFRPGHAGGRVASAQPVQQRQRVGVAGVTVDAIDPLPTCWESHYTAVSLVPGLVDDGLDGIPVLVKEGGGTFGPGPDYPLADAPLCLAVVLASGNSYLGDALPINATPQENAYVIVGLHCATYPGSGPDSLYGSLEDTDLDKPYYAGHQFNRYWPAAWGTAPHRIGDGVFDYVTLTRSDVYHGPYALNYVPMTGGTLSWSPLYT